MPVTSKKKVCYCCLFQNDSAETIKWNWRHFFVRGTKWVKSQTLSVSHNRLRNQEAHKQWRRCQQTCIGDKSGYNAHLPYSTWMPHVAHLLLLQIYLGWVSNVQASNHIYQHRNYLTLFQYFIQCLPANIVECIFKNLRTSIPILSFFCCPIHNSFCANTLPSIQQYSLWVFFKLLTENAINSTQINHIWSLQELPGYIADFLGPNVGHISRLNCK